MSISVYTTIYFLFVVISNANCDILNYVLIRDYLQWKNINVALFFVCELSTWNKDVTTIKDLKNHNMQIAVWDMSIESNLSKFDYDNFLLRTGYPLCVIVDWECLSTSTMLEEISKRKMFHYERYWLMFGVDADVMFNALSLELINIDAEVTIAVSIGGENERPLYEIHDVYNPSCKRNGQFRMDLSGNWSLSSGLKIYQKSSKFDRRHNIGGTTFKGEITIPKLPPSKTLIEHINSDEFPFRDTKERGNYRVYQILSTMFNFKVVIRRGKIWGALKPNGFWLGVVGSLNRSEIDLSITTLRWENDRYGVFDQTTDTFYVNNVFIFRHPKSVDIVTVFLTPFDGVVWLSIVAFGIVFSGLMRKLLFISSNDFRLAKPSSDNECSYGDSFLMVFGFLFQQGYASNASFTSSRIFILSYLIFALLIYQFYSSFIVGSLLTETPKTIKTMKQLLQSKLDLAMDELPYIQDILHYNTEESAVRMYNKIMAQPMPFLPLYKGLNLVKDGSLALDTDGVNAYPILKTLLSDRQLCDLQEVRVVAKMPAGPGLPKKSPLRELMKIGIRKLYETGILSHIWNIWIARLPKCSHSEVDVEPIDLAHFSSALIVLSFGMQISIAVLIIEIFHKIMLRRQLFREKNQAGISTQLRNWS